MKWNLIIGVIFLIFAGFDFFKCYTLEWSLFYGIVGMICFILAMIYLTKKEKKDEEINQ